MKRIQWIILIGLAIGCAGCAQVFPTAQSSDLPTEVPAVVEQAVEIPDQPTQAEPSEAEPTQAVEESTAAQPTSESDQTGESESQPAEVPSEEGASEEPAPTESAEPATAPPAESPNETTSLGSSELLATNPANVNLASGKVQLVEFFAFWWPVCRSMAPIVHGLENKYDGQINFVYLDIDDGNTQRFREALGYYYQPHIFLLDAEGNIIQQWIGYVQQTELEAAMISALQNSN